MLVIVPQSTVLSSPVANQLHAMLKVPNTLIKQVYLLYGKLKTARPQPKLAKAQAQKQHQPHLPISVEL